MDLLEYGRTVASGAKEAWLSTEFQEVKSSNMLSAMRSETSFDKIFGPL